MRHAKIGCVRGELRTASVRKMTESHDVNVSSSFTKSDCHNSGNTTTVEEHALKEEATLASEAVKKS